MRLLRRVLPCALLGGLLLVLGAATAAWLAVEPQPLVVQTAELSPHDIARAHQLLLRNDPRGKLPGIVRFELLSQRDLELLANQAGRRAFGGQADARARVQLQPGLARVQLSLALPGSPSAGWLNLQATLRQTAALPTVERLRLGRLPVPGWLAEALLPRLLQALGLRAEGELAQRMVSGVDFASQRLLLRFAWPDDPQQQLGSTLVPVDEQLRLLAYAERLAALGGDGAPRAMSMAQLLPPLFALARQRSTDAASAARENRAALVTLALAVNARGLSAVLAPARRWPPPPPLVVTLAARQDTPQHYLVSAALAAETNGPLADAIGLYKELSDSRGGSGFSFNDLAADRAGTRLGQLAIRSPLALQMRLAAPLAEADLLPAIADLPENMPEAEFKRRFGGLDAPAYRQMMADIEARLDRLPLLAAPR